MSQSQLRKLKQRAQKENDLRIKRVKAVFSIFFIATIVISFTMLMICAINNTLTLMTTAVSVSGWFAFVLLYAYAIKNKWYFLFDECSTGRFSSDLNKTEAERKRDNWQGNCFKFAISVAILLVHLVLLFTLL